MFKSACINFERNVLSRNIMPRYNAWFHHLRPDLRCSATYCPAHTDRFFVVRSSEKKSDRRSDFFSDRVSAHDRFYVASSSERKSDRFFLGLKSAHTDRFFVASNSEKRSERFYIWAKVSAHETIFTPIFCLRQKIGPCVLGIYG